MTHAERDAIWSALLAHCASDPARASRIVMLGRKEFDDALRLLTGPQTAT